MGEVKDGPMATTNNSKGPEGKQATGTLPPRAMTLHDPVIERQTLIEEGTLFKGSLSSSCPIIVKGRIEGDVNAPALTVSGSGAVHGKVKVAQLRSQGEIAGNFEAESVQLSGVVKDKTVVRAQSLEVRLQPKSGKIEVVFGECELDVVGHSATAQATSGQASAASAAAPHPSARPAAPADDSGASAAHAPSSNEVPPPAPRSSNAPTNGAASSNGASAVSSPPPAAAHAASEGAATAAVAKGSKGSGRDGSEGGSE